MQHSFVRLLCLGLVCLALGCNDLRDDESDAAVGGADAGDGGMGIDASDSGTPPDADPAGDAEPSDGSTDSPNDGSIDGALDDPPDAAGDGGDASGQAPLPTFAEFCVDLREAICEWWSTCRGEGCATFFADMVCAAGPDLAAAGLIAFDATRAEPCLQEHTSVAGPEDCQFGPPPLMSGHGFGPMPAPNGCTGIVRGLGTIGDACYPNDIAFTDGCAEGYCLLGDSCPGTCTRYATAGAPCSGGVRCDPELYCSAGGSCERPRSAGQTCSAALDQRCSSELYCDGVCLARVAEGGSCDDGQPCLSGLTCASSDSPGAPDICVQPRGLGESCTLHAGCFSPLLCIGMQCSDQTVGAGERCVANENCAAGFTCQDDGTGARVCLAALGEGAACSAGEQCAPELECASIPSDATLRCYALGTSGQECGPRGCAENFFCDENVCTALAAEGEACDSAEVYAGCQSGLLCMADARCHPPGEQGEPCNGSDVGTCTDPLFCDRATMTCAQPAAMDEPCHPDDFTSCQDGLYCDCPAPCSIDYAMAQPEQTCQPKRADGTTCTSGEQCLSGGCDEVCGQPGCRSPAP